MLSTINNLILDMDGVLWRGDTAVSGLIDFFAAMRRLDISVAMATNNATKIAAQYVDRFAGFGVTIEQEQVVTSAEATAAYLSKQHQTGTAVYAIGENGLHQALTNQGFHVVSYEEGKTIKTVPLVVVGFNRHVTYKELAIGSLFVHRGAQFVATNPDASFPSEIGPMPGAGALWGVIETATGISPLVIGKPGPIMFQQAVERLGGTLENTAMVGDRVNTDIAGGNAAGLTTIMVLTGISTRADAESADAASRPDCIFEDITALQQALETKKDLKSGM